MAADLSDLDDLEPRRLGDLLREDLRSNGDAVWWDNDLPGYRSTTELLEEEHLFVKLYVLLDGKVHMVTDDKASVHNFSTFERAGSREAFAEDMRLQDRHSEERY